MNWININEINDYKIEGENILVWQNNLSDKNSSRFQRALFQKGNQKVCSFIEILPRVSRHLFMEDKQWISYDLEGDQCQITHFAIVESPII